MTPHTATVSRRPHGWQQLVARIAVAAAAVFVACGLCELGARMIFPPPPAGFRQPQLGYLRDPELRYVPAASQKGWIDDGFVTINSLGFRGPEPAVPKPSGRFRIAVIGDSLTLGWGVHDQETYAARLEQLLRRRFPGRDLDVVNLGIGGYNTRQEVTFLARYVPRLEPDLVLVGFYANDLPDALDDEGPAGRGGTRIAAKNARPGQLMYINPTPTGWLDRQLRKSRAAFVAGRAYKRLRGQSEWGEAGFALELDLLAGRSSADLDRAWQRVAAEFERLRALSHTAGFSVAIVVLPPREQVTGQAPSRVYQNRIGQIAAPLGFHVIDPLPALATRDAANDLFIPYDRNHPSAEGHRLIAEAILRYVEERKLIEPRAASPAPVGGK
jgi:lysophospholipase L1-like esterase